jgi:hypothetical protein
LIIPLFSVLSRGLGGWYIFEESSVSMSLNWNIISSKNLPAWWNRETSSCQPHLLSSSHLYVQGFMICVPHVSTRFQMFPPFRTSELPRPETISLEMAGCTCPTTANATTSPSQAAWHTIPHICVGMSQKIHWPPNFGWLGTRLNWPAIYLLDMPGLF